ncbi:MAG: SurA N-terminal domain-containing protein [Alphaproteobacteria bacterium]
MLVNLRKVAGTWVMAIFSFLIIISFGIWGIGDIFRGRTSNTIATVGDVEISDGDLRREFRRALDRLQSRFGGQLNSDQARQLGLVDLALDGIVSRTLYDLEASRLGLAVGDDLVRRAIATTPAFQGVTGTFDPSLFASALAGSGLSEEQYVALLRNDIRHAQLADSIAAAAVTPEFVAKALYRYREERRTADFFVIDNASVEGLAEPDDAALAAFHEAHAERFTAPEYRKLTYVHVTPEDLASEVAVTDEELRTEFEDRRASLTRPERRTVEQILLPDEATARKARDRLGAGTDFATVARDMGGAAAGDAALGTLTRRELGDLIGGDVADDVFALVQDEVSQPIKTPLGWHLFRVTAIEPESTPALDEVRDEIAHDIALRGAVDALYQLTTKLDDELAGGASLEEAAGRLKLPLGHIDAVSAAGATPEGTQANDLPPTPEFLSTAFSLQTGETSLLSESDDGSYFIVRVDDVTPSALRPLDEIRDEVAAAWREAEREKAGAKRAADAAKRLDAGEAIDKIAGEFGATVLTSGAIRRDGNGAGPAFTADLVAKLFTLEPGKSISGRTGDSNGHVVARLGAIIEADPSADREGLDALRKQFRSAIVGGLAAEYRKTLEARFPVHIDEQAVNALF